mmetsp:Transcript_26928/g.49895  ORF Transcript_26928/g.49895 Transcript_26928/m.49895 type:complete len:271 (+) Transcript_26928:120-932(+)
MASPSHVCKQLFILPRGALHPVAQDDGSFQHPGLGRGTSAFAGSIFVRRRPAVFRIWNGSNWGRTRSILCAPYGLQRHSAVPSLIQTATPIPWWRQGQARAHPHFDLCAAVRLLVRFDFLGSSRGRALAVLLEGSKGHLLRDGGGRGGGLGGARGSLPLEMWRQRRVGRPRHHEGRGRHVDSRARGGGGSPAAVVDVQDGRRPWRWRHRHSGTSSVGRGQPLLGRRRRRHDDLGGSTQVRLAPVVVLHEDRSGKGRGLVEHRGGREQDRR